MINQILIPHKHLKRTGYILNKALLSDDQLKKIRTELEVKPAKHPDYVVDDESFKVYKEYTNTIVVPRYYGELNYGQSIDNSDLTGIPMNVNFIGSIRQEQQPILDSCLKSIREDGGGIISLPCGFGKCLALNTRVVMFDGEIKPVQDIKVNDLLAGDNGKYRKVLSLARGQDILYEVVPEHGLPYTVNKEHILCLIKDGKKVDIPIKELIKEDYTEYLGYRTTIIPTYKNSDVSIHPYTMGKNIDLTKQDARLPIDYIMNDTSTRLSFLEGLMTQSNLNSGYPYIVSTSEELLKDVVYLCHSLYINTKYINKNSLEVFVSMDKTNIVRKNTYISTYKFQLVCKGIGNYYGFEIDGNRRFLLGDFTVTHNTILSIKITCELGLKTLVIVHKTFLQNQWYERIKQFTNARVGIIRQKKKDVVNKDIVIAMLQSVAMIDYDPEIFKEFGTVIIDECHHTPSRVFSQALQKIGCKYTIGLSATPYRQDGLTKILYWYLGKLIYKVERKGDKKVIVNQFKYHSDDKLFGERKQWLNGKTNVSVPKMVTNVSKIISRNNMIIDMIITLKDKENRKILILSHRLEHLDVLKKGVDDVFKKKIENGEMEVDEYKTAYYIGGMKEYELNDAATADIIFATYAMAEEGLDIDSLNTLILATPKKDIVQSIGRVMRKPIKEGDVLPMIIDIAEQFSLFKNWATKRKKYYQGKSYTVNEYMCFNDKCISMKEYLEKNGIDSNKLTTDFDIRKEYLCYAYDESWYEEEEELGFEGNPIEKYSYDPNLDNIFTVNYDEYFTDVCDIVDNINLEFNETDNNNTTDNSIITGDAKKPSAKTSVKKPSAKTSVKKPSVKTSVKKPSVKTSVKKPSVKTSVKKPSVKTSVKTSVKKPSVKTSVKKPSVKNLNTKDIDNQINNDILSINIFERARQLKNRN